MQPMAERTLPAELSLPRLVNSPAPARALVFPACQTGLKSRVQTQNGAGERHPRSFRWGKALARRRQEHEGAAETPWATEEKRFVSAGKYLPG